MDLPTDILRTFTVAANEESYTAASSIVHRTQSAVSMQMKRLEELVGCSLFQRNGHSMKLTSEGQILLQYAQRILKLHDEAIAKLSHPELSGRVRLGASSDYTENVLPLLLARFAAMFPHIQVDLACEPEFRLVESLKKGEIDILIQTSGEKPSTGRIIHRERVVWVSSGRYPVHEQDPVPLAVYNEECVYRNWAIDRLTKIEKKYRIAYTSPSTSGILAAVRSGLAVAPVGLSALSKDIRILDIRDGFPELPTAYVTIVTASQQLSPAVESLHEHVIKSFEEFKYSQRNGFEKDVAE
ncbi:MAG: LysR substrate-binding domain-containing protein [Proteobacteria bacterium]|nr:LysR substrate-binding domain-containing protein [Pseudomonadota bacterium]